MQFSPRPGDAVTARGARWVVVDVRPFDACRLITLSGTAPPFVGIERRLLHPFDRIDATERRATPRVVSGARWRTACRAAIADDTPPGSLRRARTAGIDLLPHQLEPALSILAGRGCRVLLADEVGLGKTIQAGLILAELLTRSWVERVLVLTPAGLRDQWTGELARRFGIDAALVSASSLRRLAATLPIGMNPWTAVPLAVASTDYVKRAEVLPAVAACRWDAIVVDEAHGTAGDSDRRTAVQALAARASYVLLLTATPHSGDRDAFASLCRLGGVDDDRMLVFRRRRADVRAGQQRHVRTLRVRLTPAERAMHAALARYADALRSERGEDGCLALSVLHKRAFSSPWSLARSVERRLDGLEAPEEPDGEQLKLPLGDPEGDESDADRPPAWPSHVALGDPVRDRRLLTALLDASRAAAAADRKLAALARLLRRANESAIVFTEYRDTLRHVERRLAGGRSIVTLHGGMTREERAAALAEFDRQPRAILLATDAAGEGLNLQRGCRLVVNLELPWNPTRLEQRIGRVDRIGQTRIVHAVHLVAGGTGEARILERLQARVARAQADIGASDPVGGDEARIARLAIAGDWRDEPDAPIADLSSLIVRMESAALRDAGVAEVARIETARLVARRRICGDRVLEASACDGPLVVRSARARLRSALGSKALFVWQLACEDQAGRAVESCIVAVLIDGLPRASTSAALKQTIRELTEHLAPSIDAIGKGWFDTAAAATTGLLEARLARERAMLASPVAAPSEEFQPGLFDRRAERDHRLASDHAEALQRQLSDRIASIERLSSIARRAPALLFAVLP